MKNLAKKATKPTTPDMTPKQFQAALSRHGMKDDVILGYVSMFGGLLSVCRLNAGTNRRAQLSYLLAAKDKYEAEHETEIAKHDAEIVSCLDAVMAANSGHEGEVIRKVESVTAGFNISYGSTPVSGEAAISGNLSEGAIIPSAKPHPVGFTSTVVADLFDSLVAKHGKESATKALQNAVRDCGKKTVVDGKLGPYTLKLANKIAEADLLKALTVRATETPVAAEAV